MHPDNTTQLDAIKGLLHLNILSTAYVILIYYLLLIKNIMDFCFALFQIMIISYETMIKAVNLIIFFNRR